MGFPCVVKMHYTSFPDLKIVMKYLNVISNKIFQKNGRKLVSSYCNIIIEISTYSRIRRFETQAKIDDFSFQTLQSIFEVNEKWNEIGATYSKNIKHAILISFQCTPNFSKRTDLVELKNFVFKICYSRQLSIVSVKLDLLTLHPAS